MVTPGRASGPVVADLTVGQPAVDVLPLEQLAEAARAALPGNPKALLYTHTEGAAELIDVVRAKLRHYEGLDLDQRPDRHHQWLGPGDRHDSADVHRARRPAGAG